MLDSRRLRVLVEVARHGSFSAAAVELGYTQPAVSRQIATLEAEVGTVLVRRVPLGAVLTDAGRLLVARSEEILARLADAEAELRALGGLEGGTLRVATFASAAASVVPIAVARFRERYPISSSASRWPTPTSRCRACAPASSISSCRTTGCSSSSGIELVAPVRRPDVRRDADLPPAVQRALADPV